MGRKTKGQTKKNKNRRKPSAVASGQQSATTDVSKGEDRFLDLAKNPMFREMPKKESKVRIDDRFKQMLTNDCFQERNFRVDKRGRPIRRPKEENLEHLYELDLDNTEKKISTSSSENEEETQKKAIGEEEGDSVSSEEQQEEEPEIRLDLARGQGNISSSSSDEELEDDDNDEHLEMLAEEGEDNWGELEKGVRRVEWASRRLAICNLDWSKVRAVDLMLVLNSLKPPGGVIHSVSVYLSDFGAEHIEKEKHGPLLKLKPAGKGNKDADFEELTKQAIRAYEMDKLRYYYAVCVCDSIETATAIYETCDGVEYESSGLRFDIRFVPDETQFEDERIREQINADQFNPNLYKKPKRIETHSLAVSNPKMSWEKDDPERRRTFRQAFNEEAKLEEYESLIASGSEEGEDETVRKTKFEALMAAARGDTEQTELQSLDKSIEDQEDFESQGRKMDITWGQSNKEELGIDREMTDEEISDEEAVEVPKAKKKTNFQKYLERKKQLKQERKLKEQEQRKQRKRQQKEESPEEAQDAIIEKDERFTALFTDSTFAIDRTSVNYKGGDLASRQVKGKQKRRQTHQAQPIQPNEMDEIQPNKKKQKTQHIGSSGDDSLLVEKLKRKSSRKKDSRKFYDLGCI